MVYFGLIFFQTNLGTLQNFRPVNVAKVSKQKRTNANILRLTRVLLLSTQISMGDLKLISKLLDSNQRQQIKTYIGLKSNSGHG